MRDNKCWGDYVQIINEHNNFKPNYFEKEIVEKNLNIKIVDNVLIQPSKMDVHKRNMSCNLFNFAHENIYETHHERGVNHNVFKPESISFIKSDKIKLIETDVIYLGWVFPHYGHFLMESLSRLWFLEQYSGKAKFLFNVYRDHSQFIGSKKWAEDLLSCFNISSEDIIYSDDFYQAKRVYIPSQSLVLHSSVNSKAQNFIWNKIKSQFADDSAIIKKDKIYLSRSKLVKDKRKLENEDIVEGVFLRHGFQIVHPEEISLKQQIEILSQAKVVVGPSGSALHNAAFMRKGSLLISLTTPDFCLLNEALCCYSAKTQYELFFGASAEEGSGVWRIDCKELDRMLGKHIFINGL